MIINPPPIREPLKLDKEGRILSIPWILWLQKMASLGQVEDQFSNVLTLVSTAENSTRPSPTDDDISLLAMLIETPSDTTKPPNDVESLAINAYTPSSSSVPSNDAEMLTWMSF